jgi:ribosomal protein S18 acetylase RimI-like enzyme
MNPFFLTLLPGHTLRHPTPEDADAVLAVIVARDVADLGRPDYTLEDLHADWTLPGIDPAVDAWVVQERERLVGYAFLDDRGAALISVAPDVEGRGIGTALREAAEARALERGEALVRQYVPVANAGARALLLDAGYWPVHHYFRLRIGLAAAPPPPAGPPVRRFDPERDAESVHALVQEAFAQLEGNVAQTLDAWQAAKIEKRGWDPALWLLAEDDDGLTGAALCERWEGGVGYVDSLAVAERARGRGLGRALLLHAFAALREAGLEVAELSVQGENAGAARLYEAAGMRSVWSQERWEKALGHGHPE